MFLFTLDAYLGLNFLDTRNVNLQEAAKKFAKMVVSFFTPPVIYEFSSCYISLPILILAVFSELVAFLCGVCGDIF